MFTKTSKRKDTYSKELKLRIAEAKAVQRKALKEKRSAWAKKMKAERSCESASRTRAEGQFGCLTYVAGADGPVNQIELCAIGDLVATLDAADLVGDLLTAMDSRGGSGDQSLRKFRDYISTCAPRMSEKRRVIEAALNCALSDGDLNDSEERAVQRVATLCKLTGDQYLRLRKSWGKRSGSYLNGTTENSPRHRSKRDKPANTSPSNSVEPWYYEFLGCSPEDSDATVKRCYRALAAKLHPDKRTRLQTSPQEAQDHVRDFQRLQDAYAEYRAANSSTR